MPGIVVERKLRSDDVLHCLTELFGLRFRRFFIKLVRPIPTSVGKELLSMSGAILHGMRLRPQTCIRGGEPRITREIRLSGSGNRTPRPWLA